jgi:hypothetical protein
MQVQEQPEIQTGIYKHFFVNHLCFVEGAGSFFSGDSADEPAVFLRSLDSDSTGHRGCMRKQNFNQEMLGQNGTPVLRFTLVRELPVEKMQMLLPGAKVLGQWPENEKELDVNTFKVEEVSLSGDQICVRLKPTIDDNSIIVPLTEFLEGFVAFRFQKVLSLLGGAQ